MGGFWIAGSSSYYTFEKNNWTSSQSGYDSIAINECDTTFYFINNYFNTTDSSVISGKFAGSYKNKIL